VPPHDAPEAAAARASAPSAPNVSDAETDLNPILIFMTAYLAKETEHMS
jgi:hypothetical protein